MSEFTLYVMVIFLPGIICHKIVDQLTIHKRTLLHEIVIDSFLYGISSYLIYYIAINLICLFYRIDSQIYLIKAVSNKETSLNIQEIIWVSFLSIPFGLFISFLDNYKIFHWIGRFLRITYNHGEIDNLSHLFHSKNVSSWIVVRDLEHDLMYEGWVFLFSSVDEKDEIFLREVDIYKNTTGEKILSTPGLYIPQRRENLLIEFPEFGYNRQEDAIDA